MRKHCNNVAKHIPQLIGIDANGHVGSDGPAPFVGDNGAEQWNDNGRNVSKLALERSLTILNTLSGCKHPGATWIKRSDDTQHRLDYILAGLSHFTMINNIGAIEPKDIARQGVAVDHKPVMVKLGLRKHNFHRPTKPPQTVVTYNKAVLLEAKAALDLSKQ